MTTQTQASARLMRAEAAYGQAIAEIETYWERHGHTVDPLFQQTLEREYRRRQRALRAARTAYATLATQYGWSLPAKEPPMP